MHVKIIKFIPSVRTLSIVFSIFFLISFTRFINLRNSLPHITISKQTSAVNIQSKLLRYSTFGNPRLAASILWVQTLLESDIEHYKNNDLNSWMFRRFDTITDLDPYFYEAFLFGGQYLSVVKDDVLGAERIYQKGLKNYPDDYFLNFYSAFNYYFELNNPKMALKHYERILGHPKMPSHLPSLIAKLKAKQGDLAPALALIYSAYNNAPAGSRIKKHFEKSLHRIKTEHDLNCLNTHKKNCPMIDLYGNKYLKNKKGAYLAP